MRIATRIRLSVASAVLLTFTVSGIASACVLTAKSIDTEAGNCTIAGGAACSSAALYGANGFSGTLTFDTTGTITVWDFICTHKPAQASFKTFGGTYTLTIYDGATSLGSSSYTVPANQECVDSQNHAAGGTGVTFTVPASKVVTYTVSIAGVTAGSSAQAAFSGFNAVRNEAFTSASQARSYSVPPPTNFIIPEAPFAVLLPLTAGLLAAAFAMRRPRKAQVAA